MLWKVTKIPFIFVLKEFLRVLSLSAVASILLVLLTINEVGGIDVLGGRYNLPLLQVSF